jgi:dTDP-4-amino-4,6-dideoxygalactose transaminase
VVLPYQSASSKSVYHLYVVRTPFRDELQKDLSEAGIGTGIHYPIPIHLQRAYASMGWNQGDFPESEEAANQILSLPMFAGLTMDQQKQVVETISQFAGSYNAR